MTGNEHVGILGADSPKRDLLEGLLERGSDKLRQRTVAIHGMLGISSLRFPPGAVGEASGQRNQTTAAAIIGEAHATATLIARFAVPWATGAEAWDVQLRSRRRVK
jgi:hypothetical protein